MRIPGRRSAISEGSLNQMPHHYTHMGSLIGCAAANLLCLGMGIVLLLDPVGSIKRDNDRRRTSNSTGDDKPEPPTITELEILKYRVLGGLFVICSIGGFDKLIGWLIHGN